jgi:hypothetical protein
MGIFQGILQPDPNKFEAEYRYRFDAKSPAGPHVVVQGSINTEGLMVGNSFEEIDNEYELHLVVGPFWRDVKSVVPSVTVNGFWNSNADEDDEEKWEVKDLTWDAVSGTGPNVDEERVRLKFTVLLRGENSKITRIGYYLFARGRQLGTSGLNAPSPVKPQGAP